jgi:hypothetical protein
MRRKRITFLVEGFNFASASLEEDTPEVNLSKSILHFMILQSQCDETGVISIGSDRVEKKSIGIKNETYEDGSIPP